MQVTDNPEGKQTHTIPGHIRYLLQKWITNISKQADIPQISKRAVRLQPFDLIPPGQNDQFEVMKGWCEEKDGSLIPKL